MVSVPANYTRVFLFWMHARSNRGGGPERKNKLVSPIMLHRLHQICEGELGSVLVTLPAWVCLPLWQQIGLKFLLFSSRIPVGLPHMTNYVQQEILYREGPRKHSRICLALCLELYIKKKKIPCSTIDVFGEGTKTIRYRGGGRTNMMMSQIWSISEACHWWCYKGLIPRVVKKKMLGHILKVETSKEVRFSY